MTKVEAETIPLYRFQLPLPPKFATFASSFRFRFHIPAQNTYQICLQLRFKLERGSQKLEIKKQFYF